MMHQILRGRRHSLVLDRPRIMGILNVTPDSFSDGGRYRTVDAALFRAETMVAEGVDLIDVGGESTRPGVEEVSAELELERVAPVVEALRRSFDLPLSIDTTKSSVADATLAAGADFINDISGLSFDPDLAQTVAKHGGGLFVMHTSGRPAVMQSRTVYSDIMAEISASLAASVAQALAAGIPREALAVDPGIGFGKDVTGNLEILRRLAELRVLGLPVLLGTSRKSFIGKVLNIANPDERLYGTLATVALGVADGATIFRVHDVRAARETALMAEAIVKGHSVPAGS